MATRSLLLLTMISSAATRSEAKQLYVGPSTRDTITRFNSVARRSNSGTSGS
jgi:hypothetical protein